MSGRAASPVVIEGRHDCTELPIGTTLVLTVTAGELLSLKPPAWRTLE